MNEVHKLINHDFQQPSNAPYTRIMQDREEIIQYLPNSHIRIWHNTESVDYDSHYHKCAEIIYINDGETTATFPTKNISLNTGDIIIIPPYTMHQINDTKQSDQFILLLDVELLTHFGIYASTTSSINDILLCNKETCPHIYTPIKNNIIDMINCYFINNSYWEIETYSYFLKLLSILGNSNKRTEVPNVMPETSNHKEHYEKFAELLQYVEMNYSEPLTLDDISSHVGFSKYHFIRLFKEYTGTTFYDYLTKKRILHAKELLETNMGITEIAFSCGFNNQTSFCRAFKKDVGYPPTEYRQNLHK